MSQSPSAESSATAVIANRPEATFHWALLLLCGGVLLVASILSVRGNRQVLVPGLPIPLPELCTSRRFFGIDCPGCGLTRCFIALMHGDLRSAWSFNPAGILLFAIMAFQIPYRAVQLWRIHRGWPEISLASGAVWAVLLLGLALIAQWAARLSVLNRRPDPASFARRQPGRI